MLYQEGGAEGMIQPKMKKIFTMPPGKAEYEYAVKCRFCHETYRIDMNNDLYYRLDRFLEGEGHAEEMLHDLPPEIREMFISGMCPECWEKTFGREEDAE